MVAKGAYREKQLLGVLNLGTPEWTRLLAKPSTGFPKSVSFTVKYDLIKW